MTGHESPFPMCERTWSDPDQSHFYHVRVRQQHILELVQRIQRDCGGDSRWRLRYVTLLSAPPLSPVLLLSFSYPQWNSIAERKKMVSFSPTRFNSDLSSTHTNTWDQLIPSFPVADALFQKGMLTFQERFVSPPDSPQTVSINTLSPGSLKIIVFGIYKWMKTLVRLVC